MKCLLSRKTAAVLMCLFLCLCILPGNGLAYDETQLTLPSPIFNQDSLGFSGLITPNTLDNPGMITGGQWPTGFGDQDNKFTGGVFDGQSIWMIPSCADRVVKMNKDTLQMTSYNQWPEGFVLEQFAFYGGVFDGQSIWMIPNAADRIVKIDKDTGEMRGYNQWPAGFTKAYGAFRGGIFDGQYIWMIPSYADRVIKINKDTGEMTGYNTWPVGFTKGDAAFAGAVFDGQNIWMIPLTADRVVKIDKDTGIMTGYGQWPNGLNRGTYAFFGGVFDGENVWMMPNYANMLVKLNTSSGAMTGYYSWPTGFTKGTNSDFAGGGYDGQHIWMVPYQAESVISIGKDTGEMHRYNTWPQGYEKTYGSDSFIGGVFDGNRLWMIPFSADRVIALTDDIPVDYVYLNQGFLALLPGGESYTLKTSFLPENATNKQVTWSSDNPSVATVDDGVVTPVSEGTATITVTTVDGGKTRTCLVYVGNYADLSLGSPVMTPVPTMNAGKATIQVTITNRGLATSGISYITGMIYLKNGGWYEIFQNTKVSKIRPGKSKKMRIRVNIPDPVLTGEYTYRLTLEAEEGAYEATPGNLVEGTFANVASNLVVGSVAAEPRVSGKKTTVSAEVTNTGQGTAKNIETRFYLSTDAVLDSGDVVVGMKKISSLKAGQVKKLKFKTMLGTDPGYLIVKTDWSDSIMEDEESDNIGFYQLN